MKKKTYVWISSVRRTSLWFWIKNSSGMQQFIRICFGNALTCLGLLYWCKFFSSFQRATCLYRQPLNTWPICNIVYLLQSSYRNASNTNFLFSSQDFKCVLKFCFTLYENTAKMKVGDVQTFLSSCLGDCLIGLCLDMEFSSYSLLLVERENKEV